VKVFEERMRNWYQRQQKRVKVKDDKRKNQEGYPGQFGRPRGRVIWISKE